MPSVSPLGEQRRIAFPYPCLQRTDCSVLYTEAKRSLHRLWSIEGTHFIVHALIVVFNVIVNNSDIIPLTVFVVCMFVVLFPLKAARLWVLGRNPSATSMRCLRVFIS